MEFIPLERKKVKSFTPKPSKQVDLPKKNIKDKNQLNKLNNNLHKKNVKSLGAQQCMVKTNKSFGSESKTEVIKKRKKNIEIRKNLHKESNKKNKLEEDKSNDVQSIDEGEKDKEKLKIEKWKRLDEKKKNRLFVLRKKKITSETEVKELHPDIREIIFPRKKNSRWCWAVFESQEKANAAFKSLADNKECFVSKPNPCAKVEMKRQKKMLGVKRRLDAKKKLQTIWS